MMEKCLSPEYAKIRVNVIPWFFPQFIQTEANRRDRCDCLPEKTLRHFRAISARNSNSKYPILIPLPKKCLKWVWAPKFRGLQSPLTIRGSLSAPLQSPDLTWYCHLVSQKSQSFEKCFKVELWIFWLMRLTQCSGAASKEIVGVGGRREGGAGGMWVSGAIDFWVAQTHF